MSDILDRAEATVRAMDAVPPGQIDIQMARKDRERLYHIIKLAHEAELLLPELIAEIKRLRKQHEADWEKFSQENKQLLEDRGRLAAYVTRLEAAYVDMYPFARFGIAYGIDIEGEEWDEAHEALEKIRGEQE